MNRSPIYLDNAATTQVYPEVVDQMVKAMRDVYGNPSSPHAKGFEAEQLVKEARRTIAMLLDADPQEIVFTSGATESNHLAIKGAARARARLGRHIVLTSIEHPSALNAASDLETEGFELSYVDPDQAGRIPADAVRAALREDTVLVCVMSVNNETGSLQDLAEIVRVVRASAPKAVIHTDAVQAFCKLPFHPGRIGVDFAAITAHKFHGPKGVGALWVRKGTRLKAMMGGSQQEGGLRSGTENVPGIVGFAAAASMSAARAAKCKEQWAEYRAYLIDRLCRIDGVRVNGSTNDGGSSPHILNVSFPGIPGEVLVRALSERGLFVSTGSACTSKKSDPKKGSHVLRAMGIQEQIASSAIRISFSFSTTREEIEAARSIIEETVLSMRSTLR